MTQHFFVEVILKLIWYNIYVHSLNISRANGRAHQVLNIFFVFLKIFRSQDLRHKSENLEIFAHS